jgi:hypothetical protein
MITGAPWNGAINVYFHPSTDAHPIYKGSLVISSQLMASPSTKPSYEGVHIADDGDTAIVGVAWTFGTTPQIAAQVDNLNAKNFAPASTDMYVGVIDDPNVIFSIQDSSVLTASDLGKNFDTTANADGSTVTGRSSAELASSGYAATAQLQLLRMVPREDNSLLVNADWEVRIHETRALAGNVTHTT